MTEAQATLEAELQALIRAGSLDDATAAAIRGWGPEVLGWLAGVLRDDAEASDAFSVFAEQLWQSLRRYDGRCSTRTWCYMLARHAASRVRAARAGGAAVPLTDAPVSAIAAEVRTVTAAYQRTAVKAELRALRAELDDDDQTLLILRVDRELGWREIAHVLGGEDVTAAQADRDAAALRKRFERIKAYLRERMAP